MQVTTKGGGLNPNAKVWQEIPNDQIDIPEWTEWNQNYQNPDILTYLPLPDMADGMNFFSSVSREFFQT